MHWQGDKLMRHRYVFRLCLLLLLMTLTWPTLAHAQGNQTRHRDSLWNGILIGAGVGAAVGMLIAPPAFCGNNDSECATIVRVAIGLPAIAGGVGIGALVDGLQSGAPSPQRGIGATRPRISGVQMSVRF
jgi:hypothetical protein